MDGNNILAGGADKLNEIKEQLIELNGYQADYAKISAGEQKLEKSINSAEKDMSDEISSTLKKRRQEIEETFDKQLSRTAAQIRKIRDKRDKRKNMKVSERISEETASLNEENTRLKLETKAVFRQNHIPRYCNTAYYYALYYPRYFRDIIMILCTLLVTLLIIPCGIYFFLLPEEKIIYLILIYIITVIVFGGLYILIGNHTKDKHPDGLKQVRALREKIRTNNKKINEISKHIRNDRDESTYGLESFDEELTKLGGEEAEIVEKKKDALLTFENTTSNLITSEIKEKHREKLENLRAEHDRLNKEISELADKIKVLTIRFASDYEPLLGKEMITPEKLDQLADIIRAGNASTISEAVAIYRQNTGQ